MGAGASAAISDEEKLLEKKRMKIKYILIIKLGQNYLISQKIIYFIKISLILVVLFIVTIKIL